MSIGADLLANIIGGIVAALLFALLAYLWDLHKQKILKKLTEIMGLAIKIRNIGEQRQFADENVWVRQAKEIEEEAVAKARQLSPTAGSLVEWLDRVDPWNVNSEVEKYISILNKVIKRIRGLMERHS